MRSGRTECARSHATTGVGYGIGPCESAILISKPYDRIGSLFYMIASNTKYILFYMIASNTKDKIFATLAYDRMIVCITDTLSKCSNLIMH